MPIKTAGFAAKAPKAPLEAFQYEHRDVGEHDVHIKTHYAGVCHSDIHQGRDEWFAGTFPMVPGHEIAGIVEAVGKSVKKHKVGDKVGVGCMVDSCRTCLHCKKGKEQYCSNGNVVTYNGKNKDGTPTYGGYGRDIVVNEDFVLRIPANLDLKECAPLLCAGITTYHPLCKWGMNKGSKKVGVIGFGGLGHMGVKLAIAMGNEVTVISRSEKKKPFADKFGAKFLNSTNDEAMAKYASYFDLILDTASGKKDLMPYMNILDTEGIYTIVGVPAFGEGLPELPAAPMIFKGKTIGGTLIGGIQETQEMLDFCAAKNVTSTNEHIPIQEINKAWDRAVAGDVQFRFVIDIMDSCPKA
eukprot:GHVP01018546.1.p1 GENE.GHVP01018546.1~~GHVP01018546.1.p1  ORF type:complete len:355 (+),score=71.56 GHVP01018546.1:449-1513(+)